MKQVTKITPCTHKPDYKLKVAAYCRVSTDSDAQLESLETQKSHYMSYIKSRNDWEFAGIYYDEGISGTKTKKRSELLRMIDDCNSKKIDLVITKSISRFARNTADCIQLVRQLLDINVPIYFERENINTSSMESELLLSVLSSVAENESVSISENVKWSVQQRFKNGTFKIAMPPFGYKWEDSELVINEEEAKLVRRIFDCALEGMGVHSISKMLNMENIPSRHGKKWAPNTILGMLTNEKYVGDALFQKTYTDSSFKRHKNNGERDMYMISEHHKPLISPETFEAVEKIISHHRNEKNISSGNNKYQSRYVFSGIIICGECGSTFKRRTHYEKSGYYIAQTCKTHIENKEKCSMLYIREDKIKNSFLTMMNKLIFSHSFILKPLAESLKSLKCQNTTERLQDIQYELMKNTEQRNTLTQLMTKGYIDKSIYNAEHSKLLAFSDSLRREADIINQSIVGDNSRVTEIKKLLKFCEKSDMLQNFDEDIFNNFIKNIIVHSRESFEFVFHCGLRLKEGAQK